MLLYLLYRLPELHLDDAQIEVDEVETILGDITDPGHGARIDSGHCYYLVVSAREFKVK